MPGGCLKSSACNMIGGKVVTMTKRERRSVPENSDVASRDGVERLSRVFDVLELLGGHFEGLTLTEISKELKLPTSSVHNLLQRLVAIEALTVTPDLLYLVGYRAVRLGLRFTDGLEVRNIAGRYLTGLSAETGEDVYLAVGLGRKVSYIDRSQGTSPVTVSMRLGQPLYLHSTAVGKLYSAYVESFRAELLCQTWPRLTVHTLVDRDVLERECAKIRLQEYAISREESHLGIVGVAVPVCDASGSLVAALHSPLLQNNLNEDRLAFILAASQAAAANIERDLGRSRHN